MDKELKNFSISRALSAQISGTYKNAGLEEIVSKMEKERLQKEPRGIFIPPGVLNQSRVLSASTATDGKETVAEEKLGLIDVLRDDLAISKLGATSVDDLVGNSSIPRLTTGTSGLWLAAEDDPAAQSNPKFDTVTLTPRTVATFVDISRQLLLQSNESIDRLIVSDIARSLANAIDSAAINGTGASGQPTGILNQTGVGLVSLGANGAAQTWQSVVDLESTVGSANGMGSAGGYVGNHATSGKLKTIEKASSTAQFLWNGDGENFNGYPLQVTNMMPSNLTKGTGTNLSAMVFSGAWENLLIGSWGGLDVLVDRFSFSDRGRVRIVAFASIDIALRHPESFSKVVDIVTT